MELLRMPHQGSLDTKSKIFLIRELRNTQHRPLHIPSNGVVLFLHTLHTILVYNLARYKERVGYFLRLEVNYSSAQNFSGYTFSFDFVAHIVRYIIEFFVISEYNRVRSYNSVYLVLRSALAELFNKFVFHDF
jgi:hypothetical protein